MRAFLLYGLLLAWAHKICYSDRVPNEDKIAVTARPIEPAPTLWGIPAPATSSPPGTQGPFYVRALRSGQQLLQQNPALGLTLGYLFLTAVGMVYEWLFFDRFDLQIFHYAEPTDFLLVTVREPVLLVFTVLSVVLLINYTRRHSRRLEKYPRYRRVHAWLSGKRWFGVVERILSILLLVGYFTSLTSIYAEYNAKRIHQGKGSRVRVELVSDTTTAKPGEKPGKDYFLLGTTGKFLLLFDATNKCTEAVVIGNVARITAEP